MLALGVGCCWYLDKQLIVLLRVLATKINLGYKLQTVCLFPPSSGVSDLPAVGLSFGRDFSRARGRPLSPACSVCNRAGNLGMQLLQQGDSEQGWKLLR